MNSVQTSRLQSANPQKYFLISLGPQCWVKTWAGGFSSRKRHLGSEPSKASRFLLGIYHPTSKLWRELLQNSGSALARVLHSKGHIVRDRKNHMPSTSQILFQLCCSRWGFAIRCSLHPSSLPSCTPGVLKAGGVGAGGWRCLRRGTVCARAEISEGECPRPVWARVYMYRDGIWRRLGCRGAGDFCFYGVKCIQVDLLGARGTL